MDNWRSNFGHAIVRPKPVVVLGMVLLVMFVIGCDRESTETPAPPDQQQSSGDAVIGDRPVRIVPRTPATRPTKPLPAGTTCVTSECHTRLANAAQIHAPVASVACNACHADDIGGHKFPLKRAGDATCTFCHTVHGTATHQHAALKNGCVSCHQPHDSDVKFLLKADSVEQLCQKCHNVPLKRFTHGPVAKGQCTLCHQPHEAGNAKLLRGQDGARHCFTCHAEVKESIASARVTHKGVLNCNECHSPHSTDEPHLLKASVNQTCLRCHDRIKSVLAGATVGHDAMHTDQGCIACHTPHASDTRQLLRQRMDKVCLTCHDKAIKAKDGRVVMAMKSVLTQSQFLHGAIRAGDCAACHDPHGGREHALLVRKFPASSYANFDVQQYALCFATCHSPQVVLAPRTTSLTNFRDGDLNLHFVHVNRSEKGRSCKTCHAIHGSNLPNHMASEVPFERSEWAMPIGFQKSATGGSCAPGCHQPRTYDRAAPTTVPTSQPTARVSQ